MPRRKPSIRQKTSFANEKSDHFFEIEMHTNRIRRNSCEIICADIEIA